jgi:hypothetical protein
MTEDPEPPELSANPATDGSTMINVSNVAINFRGIIVSSLK